LRTVAVVLTAQAGQDSAAAAPEILAPLAGEPVIGHSVAAFEAAPGVDEIVVVAVPLLAPRIRQLLGRRDFRKLSRVIEGGETRADEARQAIGALGTAECNVLIHDAARPLVSQRVIADCISALDTHQAVCAAIPASDTMVAVENGLITRRPPRDRLRRCQTPQGFRLSVIRRGYELAFADPAFRPTDDCAVVLRYLPGVPVRLVRGSEQTFKIARPADIDIAETMLRADLP
jgi:2-C-methyl-D-erythritol 4-phosphate cytidylyltransferase